MGFFDVFKAVFVPALIAAALYALAAYVILPLIKTHRQRYSQYLPLDSISQHTNSFRDRISNIITRMIVPRRLMVFDASDSRRGSVSGDDYVFEDADGDRMVGFDVNRSDRQVRGADVAVGNGRNSNRQLEEV